MQMLALHGVLGFANETWLETGRVSESVEASLRALRSDERRNDDASGGSDRADALQSVGQQLLLLGRTDDAAECLELCTKETVASSRPERHARACLVAGLQSLHRHHLRQAWTGLQHALDAKNAPVQITVQACAALAALYFGLGMRRPAVATVEHAMKILSAAGVEAPVPRAVLTLLKVEFVVLDFLRQHEQLHDLAFWPRQEEVAGSRMSLSDVRAMVDGCRAEMANYKFLQARLDFLDGLIRVSYGRTPVAPGWIQHIEWLQAQGLSLHAHTARHEMALACIAGQQTEPLRKLMQFYVGAARKDSTLRNNLEHDYCLAKLGELSGRDDSYITHYREYAARALTHLRQTCAYITVPTVVRQSLSEIPKDDIASRLSGKYRRAYQYILSNLHHEELSIRHVAAAVGVTDRALQLAFRSALGLSPSAVIRQCRMDRIRDELHSGTVAHGTTTVDVGRRWGLRSRSAISHAYKATFGESPSKAVTLALE